MNIQTERLYAEPLQTRHFPELAQMHGNPAVMNTLGGLRSKDQTREFLVQNVAHWQQHGFGLWMFYSKATDEFVGRAGLRHAAVDDRNEVELAYALVPPFWLQGFATEMARALVRIGRESLGLPDIVCFTLTNNLASQRVMQKAGFVFEKKIVYANLPHVLYRIDMLGNN